MIKNLFKNQVAKLFYKSGESVTNSGRLVVPAVVTGTRKQLSVTIPCSKKLDKITSVTVTKFNCGFRTPSGGYLNADNYDYVANSSSITTYIDKETQTVTFAFITSGEWGTTGNTIYNGVISQGNLEFTLT